MKYLAVLDADSQVGTLMLAMRGKIGGASDVVTCGVKSHPAIFCSAVDWGISPAFVRLTHLTNPPDQDSAQELVVPHKCILFVVEHKQNVAIQLTPSAEDQNQIRH